MGSAVGKQASESMPLSDVIGTQFLASDGNTRASLQEVVKDAPLVGIYFSAHWCGPCRGFTPQLVTFKKMLEEEEVNFPIIFATSDKDDASFQEYFKTMTGFNAFPHGDERIAALNKKYAVSGIPWLVVLDAQGNLVLNEADTEVGQGPEAYKNWLKKSKALPAAWPFEQM